MLTFTLGNRHGSTVGTVSTTDDALTPEQLEEHKIGILPWITSPLKDNQNDELIVELRHESSPLELCFDLFFIANLSTFTATHSIIDTDTLVAYVGLFAIIWFTWFQITLYDVRFSVDSVWERACKIVQFVLFTGFALVGSSFNPGGKEHNNTNFRILCGILFTSRLLFAIQYSVALFFIRRKTKALTWPLSLTIIALILMAGSFYSMTPAFSPESGNGLKIYYVWYLILVIELAIIIGLSSIWRQLSFKKTHLMERMGLLTLMVIGEGAIGVTKTVAKLMGKSGVTVEGCILTICIVVIMMFLWMLYFDNLPRHHFGTIKQQIWSFLHFPLHVGIVGVLEGSQQVAIARNIFVNLMKVERSVHKYCVEQNLDGTALADAIGKTFKSLKLDEKLESRDQAALVTQEIAALANQPGICSYANTRNIPSLAGVPASFSEIMTDVLGALFQSTGINIPKSVDPSEIARSTFLTLYTYYWASLWMTLVSFAVLFWLTRHKERKAVLFDRFAMSSRIGASVLAAIGGIVAASQIALYHFIRSPAILPTVAVILLLVIGCDRVGRQLCVRKLRNQAPPDATDGTQLATLSKQSSSRDGYVRATSVDHPT